ncbi:thermonuclease family protein [Merismopedia glauca]|uniref:Nuclease n=1 Tax=Merismopedia glauca CCAP 1448/3 TaxID=1296344 RepID=A0A2T1C2F4_9CYAN|nr:thermonuclease family protein [Merismopedia glauca]PSB02358.1 nuclease [Merismopedia glauca CCAP 1448/3]
MKPLLLLVLVGLALQQPSSVLAQTTPATIVSVGDGDTVRVQLDRKLTTIRLACLDAPEIRQIPYGNASASRLKQLLPIGKSIDIRAIEKDRYGRTVGEIFVNNKSINLQMVAEGQAVVYRQYPSFVTLRRVECRN